MTHKNKREFAIDSSRLNPDPSLEICLFYLEPETERLK